MISTNMTYAEENDKSKISEGDSISGQWQIKDFPEGVRQLPKWEC